MSAGYSFTTDGAVSGAPAKGRVKSVCLLNGTGSVNHVMLYDGTSATGKVLAAVTLAASSCATITDIDSEISIGIFADVTGDVVATVWVD